MADLALTIATLKSLPRNGLQLEAAGAAITPVAAPVYRDPTDGSLKAANCTTQAAANVVGCAVLGAAAAGEYGGWCSTGDLNFGSAVLTMGVQYVLSATTGKICPRSDLVTGNWITFIGYPISTSVLRLNITPTGQQVP